MPLAGWGRVRQSKTKTVRCGNPHLAVEVRSPKEARKEFAMGELCESAKGIVEEAFGAHDGLGGMSVLGAEGRMQ